MSENEISDLSFIKIMIKKYWKVLVIIVIGIILAIILAIFTLFAVIRGLEIGDHGQAVLGQFSVGDALLWCLWIIVWELVIIVLPTIAIIGTICWLWWRNLPQEEKDEIKRREKKNKKEIKKYGGGAGAFGFFIFLFYLLILHLDGNVFDAFNSLPYIYWIETWFMALLYMLVIVGTPVIIGGIWYLHKKWKSI